MTAEVSVRHNFETGHRLPHLGGKCTNLHGHSWWATWTLAADTTDLAGTVCEFGLAKKKLREWVDRHIDHGLMLGVDDPLHRVLTDKGQKIFTFGQHNLAVGLEWPTVENVARLLHRVAETLLVFDDTAFWVSEVTVSETHVNTATYRP